MRRSGTPGKKFPKLGSLVPAGSSAEDDRDRDGKELGTQNLHTYRNGESPSLESVQALRPPNYLDLG